MGLEEVEEEIEVVAVRESTSICRLKPCTELTVVQARRADSERRFHRFESIRQVGLDERLDSLERRPQVVKEVIELKKEIVCEDCLFGRR